MRRHENHGDLASLAWFEEFGVGSPELGPCMCRECAGEASSDLGPSLASLVSATSALCR
jgi:hypothetical protein